MLRSMYCQLEKYKPFVLVCSSCYNKTQTAWVACKQQKVISHRFRDWQLGQGLAWSGEGPVLGCRGLTCPQAVGGVFGIRALIPSEGPTSPLNTFTLGVGISIRMWGTTHSDHSTVCERRGCAPAPRVGKDKDRELWASCLT